MKISEITNYLDHTGVCYTFSGNPDFDVTTFCPLKKTVAQAITWARQVDIETYQILASKADLLVILPQFGNTPILQCNVIEVDNPHKTFFKIIEYFFYKPAITDYSQHSVIESTHIGSNLSIGAFSYIGPDVVIGNNCSIGSHVSIEGSVVIGNNVIIESGVRVGTWGFGHYLNDDGTSTMIPHMGGVTIGNNVFLGADTIVARGTLSDTVIKDHVKIDAQCCICHNAEIGECVLIAGGTGIAGSALIKKGCWIAPRCVINASVVVGENAFIGINSVVTKDIPDDQYVFEIPAKVIRKNADTKYKI